ncbi:MAG: hypothetical protein OXF61_12460 [Acidimicrobiaceae bacterium]|nr:hypothetical protein [Acidimicrobiaceae bacterium]MCY3950000.1 hypothetical protein [Acidimicrobiaceae bacterium]
MAKSSPVRVDEEIHAAAQAIAPTMGRSTSQQISYWARIGRELERAPNVSIPSIERVLAGEMSYDDLNSREQSLVRAEWAARTEQRRRSLDLVAEFEAAGMSYVEQDDEGRIIRHQP